MGEQMRRNLRECLEMNGAPLFGTFIKSPSVHNIEIIGGLGYDFVLIDAEHAPFDRSAIELLILAARASGVMALVRVGDINAHDVLTVLDAGASGVVAPHISSAEKAQQLVAMSRYAGSRGFSNSPRAGGYGARSLWEHVDQADKEVAIIAMIEDPKAVENIDLILATEGLDAIFIGRGDLAVAMRDRAPGAPQVKAATETVLDAAEKTGTPVFILANSADDAAYYRKRGVRGFVLSSDQGFLRLAAQQALSAYSAVCADSN